MLELYTYNAGKGDCLRIRFGLGHNVFIDSGVIRFGPRFQAVCEEIQTQGEQLDLLVITHMDEDHLGGALWLARQRAPFPFERVLMNGTDTASANSPLSAKQNSELHKHLVTAGIPTAAAVKGDAVGIGGAVIKILWPTEEVLRAVYREPASTPLAHASDRKRSMAELAEAPLRRRDASQSNRASIVLSFSQEDRKLLFTGDAWGEDVISNVDDASYDLIKLPHHGSAANISEEWSGLRCKRYIICADGVSHPDKQTIAKIQKWNGDITIYSPSVWWSRGFLLPEDASPSFQQTDGQAIGVI